LIAAWSRYKKSNGENAINESPLEYSSENQFYIAIALEIAGDDLEKFEVSVFKRLFDNSLAFRSKLSKKQFH
jgi:hypothetical protein